MNICPLNYRSAGASGAEALSNAVRHRMPREKNFSYKKITNVAKERFTVQNMAYTQMIIDYLHIKDPYTFRYFDEWCEVTHYNGSRHYLWHSGPYLGAFCRTNLF